MRDHTSLVAWQVAHEVAVESLRLCRECWKPWAAAAFGQLQRAALSAQLNIAEGYSCESDSRKRYHYGVAYGSAVEAGDVMRVLEKLDIMAPARLTELQAENLRSQQLLLGLKRYVASRELAGAANHQRPGHDQQHASHRCDKTDDSATSKREHEQAPGEQRRSEHHDPAGDG